MSARSVYFFLQASEYGWGIQRMLISLNASAKPLRMQKHTWSRKPLGRISQFYFFSQQAFIQSGVRPVCTAFKIHSCVDALMALAYNKKGKVS